MRPRNSFYGGRVSAGRISPGAMIIRTPKDSGIGSGINASPSDQTHFQAAGRPCFAKDLEAVAGRGSSRRAARFSRDIFACFRAARRFHLRGSRRQRTRRPGRKDK